MTRQEAEELTIAEANFSQEFVSVTNSLGITKVGDMLKLTPQQIMDLPDFTFKMMGEYQGLLQKTE